MGQAKRRGNFEQRLALALERKKAILAIEPGSVGSGTSSSSSINSVIPTSTNEKKKYFTQLSGPQLVGAMAALMSPHK